MLYVLTLGWPWFASAVALGLVVGAATKPKRGGVIPDKVFALAGAAILLLLASVIFGGKLQGREALTSEVALLAGFAYFVGVLGAGAIKASIGPRSSEKPRTRYAAVPPIQLHSGGVIRRADATSAPATPSSPTSDRLPGAPAFLGERRLPGKRPDALASPRAPGPDNLKRIKGIGPKSEEKLNELGIYHFDQIADWSLDNVRWMGAALATPGRIERGKWIEQARQLAADHHQSVDP